MTRYLCLFMMLTLFAGCKPSGPSSLYIAGVKNPVISLNGTWEIDLSPSGEFWLEDQSGDGWKTIRVPGECMMQGFAIHHDEPFVYRKKLLIPPDYAGKMIMLRFDGVYSSARLWVNGQYVREHQGGFTRWECDITPFVNPGQEALILLEVTDRANEISYGSGYAKHPIGGILRDVTLLALPPACPSFISITTDLDDGHKNAELIISWKFSVLPKDGKIALTITDPYNATIPLQHNEQSVADTGILMIRNVMRSPHLWDAEHPNLYELAVSYLEKGQLVYRNTYKIGFREVEIEGNRMLVNGKEVKLRGANRHDVHPLLGRVSTPEYEKRDIRLAKEANMNFIRTSHYPPTDNFLSLCDEYGIYVEDETAACFVGSHRTAGYYPGDSENDTAYTGRYLMQLEEMVMNHRNHPSVILWSIGNENSFGSNFKLSYDRVKAIDPTRPVIFSYPGNVPDSIRAYDILSMHYPGITGDMEQLGKTTTAFGSADMPVIFDEWAHVACYNNLTLKEDPNIRDFWGRSLDSMWTRVFESDGGLGGAIWGMIDETFMLPDTLPGFNEWWGLTDPHVIPAEYSGHTVGYGEWGILDTWRRKKPEFWNTKKAYSPFKVLQTTFDPQASETILSVPVYNRFNHTNFSELKIKYRHNGRNHLAKQVNLEPRQKGFLQLPLKEWDPGEPVYLEVRDDRGMLIDQYTLSLSQGEEKPVKKVSHGNLKCSDEEEGKLVVVCAENIHLRFDLSTGLIESVIYKDENLALSGPFLNLRTRGVPVVYSYHTVREYTGWKLEGFSHEEFADSIVIRTKGICFDSIPVHFTMTITEDAILKINYLASGLPAEYIRELGIRFRMENSIDAIYWKRDPYWSYYPEEHLSAPEGTAALYPEDLKTYRNAPPHDWAFDSKSFYYDGTTDEDRASRLINKARATKENILEYSLLRRGQKMLTVKANGDVHCRLSKPGDTLDLSISNEMDYPDLGWGNYQRDILSGTEYSTAIILQLLPDNQ